MASKNAEEVKKAAIEKFVLRLDVLAKILMNVATSAKALVDDRLALAAVIGMLSIRLGGLDKDDIEAVISELARLMDEHEEDGE
jgi:hypothetical protein